MNSFTTLAISLIDPKKDNLPQVQASPDNLRTILNDIFIVIGALAVLLLVYAGLNYILARGNPDRITQAKNRILYLIIGLIVVALAATLVNFVLSRAP